MYIAARSFALIAPILFALVGCHELGHVDGPGDYGSTGGTLVGEVRQVDARNREIELHTESGRNWRVRYDNSTRVTYRQRDYTVTNLEPGDYVAMRTQQDRDGRLYVEQVTVRESTQDRGGRGQIGRGESFEGTVAYVDNRRGSFEVRNRQNRLVVVTLPYNTPRAVSDRFNRMREGDYVRVEGRFINQDRFELENFVQ
jgi:YD repeat-containing protein